jgi:hypothetical protein
MKSFSELYLNDPILVPKSNFLLSLPSGTGQQFQAVAGRQANLHKHTMRFNEIFVRAYNPLSAQYRIINRYAMDNQHII